MRFRDNPSKPPKTLMSIMGTDERRGWVGKFDRGSDLKGAGYKRFRHNPPYKVSGGSRSNIGAT
jgi:hypothetical protein